VAVEAGQMLTQIAQIKKPIDASQQVILGNVRVVVERIKQSVLAATLLSHHLAALHQCTARSDISRH